MRSTSGRSGWFWASSSAMPLIRPMMMAIALGGLIIGLGGPASAGPDGMSGADSAEAGAVLEVDGGGSVQSVDDGYLDDDERRRTFAAQLVDEEVSPGYYLDKDGASILRVYRDADLAAAESASLERAAVAAAPDGFVVRVERSRYTADELRGLYGSLERIETGPDGSFVGSYDAAADMFELRGNLPPAAVSKVLGDVPHEYELTKDDVPRRATRMNDVTPHYGGARIVGPTGVAVW